MRRLPFLLCCAAVFLCSFPSWANFVDNNLHSNVTISSAVSIVEADAVSFGNLAVGGTIGGGDASIVLSPDGSRRSYNGAATTLTLLSGGYGGSVYGAARAGVYQLSGASNGAEIYVAFTNSGGAPIDMGNPVLLTGPAGSDNFMVDSFTFNKDGTDSGGNYVIANGLGSATIRVGATLHTKAGATRYADGTYRGVFGIIASY